MLDQIHPATRPLFVFYEPNAEEWTIAHDEDDADAVYREMGATPDEPMKWTRLPPEKTLTMLGEDHGGPGMKKTCAEWCASNGRSYLGGANY